MSTNEAIDQRILLIDSNVFFARRLTEALKSHGFDVIHSTQASYALTMLEWNAPTAILCATNLHAVPAGLSTIGIRTGAETPFRHVMRRMNEVEDIIKSI